MLTAGLMILMPMTANAASGFNSVSGDNVGQYDNSVPPSYCNVILPTTTASSFVMELDPGEVMAQAFDGYQSGETLNFKVQSVPVSVAVESGTLHTVAFEGTSNLAAFNVSLRIGTNTTTLPNTKHYLWVPQSLSIPQSGPGEFVEVTEANLTRYFKTTDTTSIALKNRNGASVTDGKIYKATYTEISDFSDYVSWDFENEVAILGPEQMYLESNGIYTALGTSTLALQELDVIAPVIGKADESDVLKIVNKATTATLVTVHAVMGNVEDIRFSADEAFSNSSDMLYLNITGTINDASASTSSTTKAVFEMGVPNGSTMVASATLAYVVAGAGQESAIKYAGYEDDITTDKLGINWYQYEASDVVYDSLEFQIAGATNHSGDAVDLWKTYMENGIGKSTMKLTYKFDTEFGGEEEEPVQNQDPVIPTVEVNMAGGVIKLIDVGNAIGFTATASDYTIQIQASGSSAFTTVTGATLATRQDGGVNITAAAAKSWKNAKVTFGGKTYVLAKSGPVGDGGAVTVTIE